MKTFVELCEYKPSKAIRAMIEGLHKQDKRKRFIVDMEVYLHIESGMCFGCAASCAVQELTNINYHPSHIRVGKKHNIVKVDFEDLKHFELAMDDMRAGNYRYLFEFFNIHAIRPITRLPFLNNENWKENLEPYIKYAEQLERRGL